jgi:hypothetical protein
LIIRTGVRGDLSCTTYTSARLRRRTTPQCLSDDELSIR